MSSRNDYTQIRLEPNIRKRLKLLGVEKEMNYSELLEFLIEYYHNNSGE